MFKSKLIIFNSNTLFDILYEIREKINYNLIKISKIEELRQLQNHSKHEIMSNLNIIHELVAQNETDQDDQVSLAVQDQVEDLFNELEENKLDVEAANISSAKKAEVETKLDESFIHEIVDLVATDKVTKDKKEQLKDYIEEIFEEKNDISNLETDQVFIYSRFETLDEKIVNNTYRCFGFDSISTPKFSNLKNQTSKLYNAMIQVDQIAPDAKEAGRLKSELLEIYVQYAEKMLNSAEDNLDFKDDLIEAETVAVPIEVGFTRKYFRETFEDQPDKLILVLRNPYSLLISMQLKQAALAANNYEADIFSTEEWKQFATSGKKTQSIFLYNVVYI